MPEQKEITVSVLGEEITLHQDGELEPIGGFSGGPEAPKQNEIIVRLENVTKLIAALQDALARSTGMPR